MSATLHLAPDTLPLDGTANVTVQITNDDDADCWQASFAPAAIRKNTTAMFMAKLP